MSYPKRIDYNALADRYATEAAKAGTPVAQRDLLLRLAVAARTKAQA